MWVDKFLKKKNFFFERLMKLSKVFSFQQSLKSSQNIQAFDLIRPDLFFFKFKFKNKD